MNTAAQLKAVATGKPPKEMNHRDTIAFMLDQKKHELAKMLPKHLSLDRLLKVATIAATTTPALAQCEVASLIGAIGQCAQMGLEPNTVLGHAYLVPFNAKDKSNGRDEWVKRVQVIVGYKGLIDLARRSGQIVSIAAHAVHENDKFDLVYGLDDKLEHRPALGERGEILGFYAVAKLVGGGHAFEFMSRREVEQIRDGSKGWQDAVKYKKTDSHPWGANFPEMGRKTAVRRLSKFLPLSIEMERAIALDEAADRGVDQRTIDADAAFVPMPDEPAALEDHRDEQAANTVDQDAFAAEITQALRKAGTRDEIDRIGERIPLVTDDALYDAVSAEYDAAMQRIGG